MDLQVDHFLEEVSQDAICGANLEYDESFAQLVRAAEGEPERQVGDHVITAIEPDWGTVTSLSLQLLERTRDVRIVVYLARAAVCSGDLPAVERALRLLLGLLERYWDTVYPLADPEDSFPVLRMNVLSELGNYASFLNGLRNINLVSVRGLGAFNYRDVEIAEGKVKPLGDESPRDITIIDAAFKESDAGEFQQTLYALTASLSHARSIASLTTDRVGENNAPSLGELIELLERMGAFIQRQLDKKNDIASKGDQMEIPPQTRLAARAGQENAMSNPQGIHSRADVSRSIDEICGYFTEHEPSSPIPYLLTRAKGLLGRDFIEIIQDLAPDGARQAAIVCKSGRSDET